MFPQFNKEPPQTEGSLSLPSQQQQTQQPQSQQSQQQTTNFSSKLYQFVHDLTNPDKRENALLELSKKREEIPDLAPILWHSFGVISSLLQEIVCVYPLLSPPRLTPALSNRCCNALALLQCIASHQETRTFFLNSHLPLFLYPFLNTICVYRQFEYLRLTSLGVIGALVKIDDPETTHFLLQTEIIPLCLRIMENGSELSKTVATFIVQKILLDEVGLGYICATYERFSTVSQVLTKMVNSFLEKPPTTLRLLKHIIRCYLRLAENSRAREALRTCLPQALKEPSSATNGINPTTVSVYDVLKEDPVTKRWLTQLHILLATPSSTTTNSQSSNPLLPASLLPSQQQQPQQSQTQGEKP